MARQRPDPTLARAAIEAPQRSSSRDEDGAAAPSGRRPAPIRDDTYQLDAIVSLFALVLLILVTTAAAIGVGRTALDYRTRDVATAPTRLASVDAPFVRLENWVLTGTALVRLDYDAVARMLADERGELRRSAEDAATGTLVFFAARSDEIGAYESVRLLLPQAWFDGTVPAVAGIVAAVVDLSDEAALGHWANTVAPVRLFVFASGMDVLPRVLQAAEASGKGLTLTLRAGAGQRDVETKRLSSSFVFRHVLRTY